MMAGGIYDQLGGGFARYSVDAAWLVPHFEKMLYDNALLAGAYLHGWQALEHERYRRVCEETLDWMLREMRGPEGGFYSALDADSEGEEGRFYVWTPDADPRGARATTPRRRSSSTGSPTAATSRARNILHLAGGAGAERSSTADRGARAPCLRPAERGSGRASTTSGSPPGTRWRSPPSPRPARRSAAPTTSTRPAPAPSSCSETLRDPDGRLLRTYSDGEARLNAYLEDHAFLLEALLTLYEATFEQRWYEEARALADTMIDRFGDPERGGFFSTSEPTTRS